MIFEVGLHEFVGATLRSSAYRIKPDGANSSLSSPPAGIEPHYGASLLPHSRPCQLCCLPPAAASTRLFPVAQPALCSRSVAAGSQAHPCSRKRSPTATDLPRAYIRRMDKRVR